MPEKILRVYPPDELEDNRQFSIFPSNIHICHFYKSKVDLLDLLLPYFAEGLRRGEFCLWGVAGVLTVASATEALAAFMGGSLDSFVHSGQIEIFDIAQFYGTGIFDAMAVKDAFLRKVFDSENKGWTGFRCDGIVTNVSPDNWRNFQTYETEVTRNMKNTTTALCSYDISKLTAEQVVDIVSTHQASVLKKRGTWHVVEAADRTPTF